jgi:hypothetical protein
MALEKRTDFIVANAGEITEGVIERLDVINTWNTTASTIAAETGLRTTEKLADLMLAKGYLQA